MKRKLIRLSDHGSAYLYTSLEAMMHGTKYGLLLQSPDTKMPKFDLVYGGGSHFILRACTEASPLYAVGDNRFGQLGSVRIRNDNTTLHCVSYFSKDQGFPAGIQHVACGDRHTIALSTEGDAYVWGWYAPWGYSPPAPVDLDDNQHVYANVKAIACAADASVFVLADESVWINGEKGIGLSSTTKTRRVKMDTKTNNVLNIGASQWTFFMLVSC